MAIVSVSLTPEATGRLHDVLACFAKFGETVSIEARHDKLSLITLNSSKTAYASCSLDARVFFTSFSFAPPVGGSDARFTLQLLSKALLSAIKTRVQDARGRETAIDRCDITIEENTNSTICRLIVRMSCRHGMTKIYKLTYQSSEIMHALFDKQSSNNGWEISSRTLREYIEYFGPRTEQLSMTTSAGKAIFTSFTDKITDGKEVLKQPLETAIAVPTADFDHYRAEDDMQIIISVKDFRAIVTHAESLRTPLSAQYSVPGRPLQFAYTDNGMNVEFTLMTTGRQRSQTPALSPRPVTATSQCEQQRTERPRATGVFAPPDDMPPPSFPAPSQSQAFQRRPLAALDREKLAAASATQDHGSLFVPNDASNDDDGRWDPPPGFESGEAEDELAWDATGDLSHKRQPALQDVATELPVLGQELIDDDTLSQGIDPTQRLSQLHGLFD